MTLSNKGKFLSSLQERITSNSWIQLNSRRAETAITRLRIGHAGVNYHLHRFEMEDSPLCAHCKVPETIEHFIMRCPKYRNNRVPLKQLFAEQEVEFTLRNVLCHGDHPRATLKQQLVALRLWQISSGKLADCHASNPKTAQKLT